MNQNPLNQFGNSQQRMQAGLEALRRGSGVLVADDEDRENEVDLIFGAHSLNADQMAMLIRECSGIVCLCLPQAKVASLNLFPMVKNKHMFQMRGAFLTWTKTTPVPDEGSLFDLDKNNTCSK